MKNIIISNKIEIQVIPFVETKKIYIKIYYIANTLYNPLKDKMIIFYIQIKNNYPIIPYKITCNSNVFFFLFYILVHLSFII